MSELTQIKLTIQNVFIVTFLVAALVLVGGFVYTAGYSDEFVINMVQMSFAMLLVGLGAALARLRLGKNGNQPTINDPI
ncbi:hypothetical protein LCGC14_2718880 [marine sediment metagenome]|uniref:Uncharacterized protein n=1 Tax=marine sediment metagenome TaxID=412755 RepID=A0A0F9C2I9_9ZZZZ|nr:hypothetical protein [bacterium]